MVRLPDHFTQGEVVGEAYSSLLMSFADMEMYKLMADMETLMSSKHDLLAIEQMLLGQAPREGEWGKEMAFCS